MWRWYKCADWCRTTCHKYRPNKQDSRHNWYSFRGCGVGAPPGGTDPSLRLHWIDSRTHVIIFSGRRIGGARLFKVWGLSLDDKIASKIERGKKQGSGTLTSWCQDVGRRHAGRNLRKEFFDNLGVLEAKRLSFCRRTENKKHLSSKRAMPLRVERYI